jgi:hypothetical protein
MSDPGPLEYLRAPDPKQMARLPLAPIEQALAEIDAIRNAPAAVAPPPVALPVVPLPIFDGQSLTPLDTSLAVLATHIWRAQGRMVDPKTHEPREDMRRLYRHIEGSLDTFAGMGVRICDWVGHPYDTGLPLKVISFQPSSELSCDTVIEAVRPAVYWQDRLIQVGEVVVGIPPNNKQS